MLVHEGMGSPRAMYVPPHMSDAGGLARRRGEPIARAPPSCPSRPRPQCASAALTALVGPCVRRRRPSDARSAKRGQWRWRPSDARSAERGEASSRRCLPGCACAAGIPTLPTAWLRLRRPSHARSAERGARRRRPSDARSAERGEASSRRCLPACASAAGIRLQPLRAQLRLRRPSDARSAERGARRGRRETRACRSTPSHCDGVECIFAFTEGGGGAPSGASVHTGSTPPSSPIAPFHRPLPSGCAPQAPARRLSAVGAASTSSSSSSTSPKSPEPPPLRPSPQLSPPGLARAGSLLPWPNWLRDGRNVLGPAHSGFVWCMTWSMAAMGMSNAGGSAGVGGKRARELKNVCLPFGH